MPNHYWGDEWFKKHGDDLNKAIDFCLTNWERFGRLGSHGKEKFGTFRHHMFFYDGYWPIHELVKVGYIYYQWPKVLHTFETRVLSPVIKLLRIPTLINIYQSFIYNAVLQIACKKWPEIIDELVVDSDFPDKIKPGIFGKVDGKAIHDKYWVSLSSLVEDVEERNFREYLVNMDAEDYLELLKEAMHSVIAETSQVYSVSVEQLQLYHELNKGLRSDD